MFILHQPCLTWITASHKVLLKAGRLPEVALGYHSDPVGGTLNKVLDDGKIVITVANIVSRMPDFVSWN